MSPTDRPIRSIPFGELVSGFGTPSKSNIIGTICLLCLLEPKLYISPFTSQSVYEFFGRTVPPVGEEVDLGGRVSGVGYTEKVLHIKHNLFAGTEPLHISPFSSQSPYACYGGQPPHPTPPPSPVGGKGGVRGSGEVSVKGHRESPSQWA